MPTFTSDGVNIHYRDEGRGMPVLLLHAFPVSSETFAPQVEALSSKYRVITPDHRGFGKSGFTKGPTEMSRLAEDAIALLNHLNLPRAVIGGVSMGGYATMALLRINPERVRALLLLGTQMGADDEAGKARREETARAVEARGMDALLEMVPKLLHAQAAPELRARIDNIVRANSPEGSAAALRGMGLRSNSRDVLQSFNGPALVVVGEGDVLTPPAKAQEMAAVLQRPTLLEVPGAGHLVNLDAPGPVNAALEKFLAEVERS